MMTSPTGLDSLRRERPEWKPWLAVVEEVLREAEESRWDEAVPAGANASRSAVPLLAGATISLEERPVRRLLGRLIRVASVNGTPKMATVAAAIDGDLDVLALFSAALAQDGDGIGAAADASGADPEALQAVASLLPVPFLQACHRRWASSVPESWVEGYCPVCGSFPAFAEVRGIERSRHFRCGRCGGAWHARTLSCPYCEMSDHHELVALVPESGGSQAVVDACRRCLGYVKTFTRLQGCPPGGVMLEDLASVNLDVAAIEQGYARPSRAGYRLDAAILRKHVVRRRFFAWRA